MKTKIKISLFAAIAAVALTIGVSSFNTKENKISQSTLLKNNTMLNLEWRFIGDDDSDADDPAFYRLVSTEPAQEFNCDEEDYTVCSIIAPINPATAMLPDIDKRPQFGAGTNPVEDPNDYSVVRRSAQ